MTAILAVGFGGFLGAVLRYLGGLLPFGTQEGFPYKTFLINLIGCFLIGAIAAQASKNKNISPNFILFLKTGFCGGFTTFSTFSLETAGLIEKGHTVTAVIYIAASTVGGLLCVIFSEVLVKKI